MPCLATGLLIGPIRLVLAEIHNETLICEIWCEMAGGEGLAGLRLVPARKLHVYETLDLNSAVLRLSLLETCDFRHRWNYSDTCKVLHIWKASTCNGLDALILVSHQQEYSSLGSNSDMG